MNKQYVYSRRRVLAAGVVFVSLIAAGIYLQPGVSTPSPRQTGDATIVSFLTPLLSGARGSVAVALITPKGVQYALWDSDFTKQYEIASLTKTMTSCLLIEAQRRGEATPQTRVGELIRRSQARRAILPWRSWLHIAPACRRWRRRYPRKFRLLSPSSCETISGTSMRRH